MNTFNFDRLSSPLLISHWGAEPFQGDELSSANFFSFPPTGVRKEEIACNDDFDFLCLDGEKNVDIVPPLVFPGEEEEKQPTEALEFGESSKFVGLPITRNSKDVVSKDIELRKISLEEESSALELRIKKKIQKAKSVKISQKASKKGRRPTKKTSKARSVRTKASIVRKKLNSIETCSTISNSAKSDNPDSMEFEEIKGQLNLSSLIDVDVRKTFKLDSRGVKSNIPQIFSSGLFSNDKSQKIEELSNCFINKTLFKPRNAGASSQMKSVSSVLGQIRGIKGINLEAGSYMASLETTIESINKMKNLM